MTAVLAACLPVISAPAQADERVIRFAQVAALTGSSSGAAMLFGTGVRAAFAEANRRGGVKGRRLDLVTRNDGFEIGRSIEETRALLAGSDEIFGLIGVVGTAIAHATLPIAGAAGMPFIGPVSGAESLRAADLDHVVNIRASYLDEARMLVPRLIETLGAERIAVLYQDDRFGHSALASVEKTLSERGHSLAAAEAYERGTTAVKRAFLEIRRAAPDAVIVIGTAPASAAFIRLARGLQMKAAIVTFSIVDLAALAEQVGPGPETLIGAQVVPVPGDDSFPLTRDFRAALQAVAPEATASAGALEGYLAARLVIAVLEAIAGEPTRAAFLSTLKRTRTFEIGGLTLEFGESDNQGLDSIFLAALDSAGNVRPFEPAAFSAP